MYAEKIFQLIQNILRTTIGASNKRSFAMLFTIFTFVLFNNLIGMIPICFSSTSHISVTLTLGIMTMTTITIVGFIKHGLGYISILLPKNTPKALAPLIITIECCTYLSKPISLSIRLAANMTAGHVILKVIASLATLNNYLGILPLSLLVILTGFEIFVCILQAYIFTILTCVYLNDALKLH